MIYKDTLGDNVHIITNEKNADGIYAKAANNLRKRLLQQQQPFSGTFAPACEENSVDIALVDFFKQLLLGKSLPNKDTNCHCSALTLAQMTVLICKSKARAVSASGNEQC